MIILKNLSKETPYEAFKSAYEKSLKAKQKNIQALCMSSYCVDKNEVNSRYVNLKIINGKEFIFFTNYQSPKSIEFTMHNQISATLYWDSTNTQIRMKAYIKKTNHIFNQKYFTQRDLKKNALSISSNQSKSIDSYDSILENYKKSLSSEILNKCPAYWGGYSFTPYYFEFWEGHESRINKRVVFYKIDGLWKQSFLQP